MKGSCCCGVEEQTDRWGRGRGGEEEGKGRAQARTQQAPASRRRARPAGRPRRPAAASTHAPPAGTHAPRAVSRGWWRGLKGTVVSTVRERIRRWYRLGLLRLQCVLQLVYYYYYYLDFFILFGFLDYYYLQRIGLHSQGVLNRSPDLSLRQVIISRLSSTSQAMVHRLPTSELVAGMGLV